MSSEVEFKFNVLQDGLEAVRAKLQSVNPEQLELRAHYFDTPDGSFASKGVVLRLRKEGRSWVQTVKAKGAGPLARLEHEIELGELPEMPLPELARLKGTAIGASLGSLFKDATQMVLVFSTEITRTRAIVEHGNSKVEIALDIGRVIVPAQPGSEGESESSPVCELEMELVEGSVSDLTHLATEWLAQTHLSLSTISKDARGRRLLAGWPTAVAVKASAIEPPKRRARLRGDAVQRSVVSACLRQILPNATEVASGNCDHDVVHQLRVGIRRLRTALRELEDLSPGQFKPEWEEPLKRTFDALGKSRDRELLETKMQPSLERRGGPKIDLGAKAVELPLDAAVRETGFQTALVELLGLCSSDERGELRNDDGLDKPAKEAPEERPVNPKKTLKILVQRLESLHKKVVKGGEAFESLAAEEQHRVRKQLKRLRYLSEFVGPLFHPKGAARYIEHLTPAQDALGDFNDKHVAVASYRARTPHDPNAWFAVGWLSATDAADAQACRAAILEIAKAKRFWKN